ncbi:MAG: lipid-A-disaccharide synthase, partial [Leptospiraceae bacterium]|nr:lipid-A-disaccharide synthase [Leptospiraceae bacterium]
MKEDVKKILLVAGEHSGDLLGGDLLKYLKKEIPNLSFEGIGGDEMLKEGLHSITDIESMNVVGLSGIVSKYKYLKSLARQLVEICKKENIRYAILIDYPGFNLRLTKMLRAEGIEVAFFVSPQIWAWRFKRVFFIRDNISLMLTLFEFEKDIYLKYGVNAEFVGHPLVQRLEDKLKEYPPLNIEKNKRYITLMPGSRTTEIKKHLPILL